MQYNPYNKVRWYFKEAAPETYKKAWTRGVRAGAPLGRLAGTIYGGHAGAGKGAMLGAYLVSNHHPATRRITPEMRRDLFTGMAGSGALFGAGAGHGAGHLLGAVGGGLAGMGKLAVKRGINKFRAKLAANKFRAKLAARGAARAAETGQ